MFLVARATIGVCSNFSNCTSEKPSAPSGKLVFQTTLGGPFYTINVDGSSLQPITDGVDPIGRAVVREFRLLPRDDSTWVEPFDVLRPTNGTTYSVGQFRAENPDAEIVFIIGSDSLATIRQWHQPEELLRIAIPAVVQRGGQPEIDFSVLDGLVDPQRIELFRQHVIAMPVIELSSSELRSRLARNRSIRYRTPRAVEALIDSHQLYR